MIRGKGPVHAMGNSVGTFRMPGARAGRSLEVQFDLGCVPENGERG